MYENALQCTNSIKAAGKKSGKSFQWCLQTYCEEEFLRRLASSQLAGNFMLKGSFPLRSQAEEGDGMLMDLEFLMMGIDNNVGLKDFSKLITFIQNLPGENEWISYELHDMAETPCIYDPDRQTYHFTLLGCLERMRTPFHIKVNFGDSFVPQDQLLAIKPLLEGDSSPELKAFPLEYQAADRFDQLLRLLGLADDMSLFYDLYFLATHFPFQGRSLKDALVTTLEGRNTSFTVEGFQNILRLRTNTLIQKKWKHFLKTMKQKEPDFEEAMQVIEKLFTNIWDAMVRDIEIFGDWFPEVRRYID